ncbi:acyl-CoA desaturase [Kocuria sp. TGY1127_2]|uniref:fatty acid desaturase family protein n=2 Tax=unclassified Kocuria TaxID=2649579 RepID=UPI0015BF53E6|nr:acyl-CoA desaturase [Kocuria sp. TGY1127_2]
MNTDQYARAFRNLSEEVHKAGLIRRQYTFYWSMILGCVAVLLGLLAVVIVLGATWYQMITAALIGAVLAQIGFLSHEAAHREVFASRAWNEWVSRILSGTLMGMSYSWWMNKHNTHHAHPNQEGKDPDVESTVLTFTPEASQRRTGLSAKLAARQGVYFVPLLLLEGFNLHVQSLKMLFSSPAVPHRVVEISLILIRHIAYLTLLFTMLPAGMAVAFVGVQVGSFGLLLGGAFALNHIGMPTVPSGTRIDFLRRQVVMSRNIHDGLLVRVLMGGLQYQIEHHLFPAAPRTSLPALQKIVRKYCQQYDIPYEQRTLPEAAVTVVSYLNQVGLKNRDPYVCPLVQQYRG